MQFGASGFLQIDNLLQLADFGEHHRFLGVVQALGGAHLCEEILSLSVELLSHVNNFSFELSDRILQQRRVAFKLLAHALLFDFERSLSVIESLRLIRGGALVLIAKLADFHLESSDFRAMALFYTSHFTIEAGLFRLQLSHFSLELFHHDFAKSLEAFKRPRPTLHGGP